MCIAKQYMEQLKKAYINRGMQSEWEHFERHVHGACQTDLQALQTRYPAVPESLIQLLSLVDGTYWRVYDGETIAFLMLGSDLDEYPYYLLSAKQMYESRDADTFAEWIEEELLPIDPRITNDVSQLCWLHFSDCVNNGGSSQLFLDFSPSSAGTCGQIIRYVHDPDELTVIADSFDAYLQMLLDWDLDFVEPEFV